MINQKNKSIAIIQLSAVSWMGELNGHIPVLLIMREYLTCLMWSKIFDAFGVPTQEDGHERLPWIPRSTWELLGAVNCL
jgi:hypothetical protein